jgi:hypothetical protein
VPLELADDHRDGVAGERGAAGRVVAVDGLDQAEVGDLDEVVELLAAVAEAAGQVLGERDVQLDEPLPGRGRGRLPAGRSASSDSSALACASVARVRCCSVSGCARCAWSWARGRGGSMAWSTEIVMGVTLLVR